MHSLDLHHPSWYRALTLTERLASSRQDRPATGDVAVDAGRAERRLRRWRDQDPFATDGFFARRLAADAMDEDDLWRLLGEPIEAVRDRSPAPPHWLLELDRALSALPTRQRQVVTMRDVCGMSTEEVCETLDISLANQRVLLHRARAGLRTALAGYYRG